MSSRHIDSLMICPEGDEHGWCCGTARSPEGSVHCLAGTPSHLPAAGLPESGLTIMFPGSPRTGLPWAQGAWEELVAQVEALDVTGGLLLRGHHGHVLSDAPACLRWLEADSDRAGVALSPASMLAPSMLADVEDHLVRMFEYLGSRAGAVVLEDLGSGEDDLHGLPAGEGLLPGPLLGTLLEELVPEAVPIVIRTGASLAAASWLWPKA